MGRKMIISILSALLEVWMLSVILLSEGGGETFQQCLIRISCTGAE